MRIVGKRGLDNSVFYIFLILFFGWILSQFILINQNSLLIKDNQITGMDLLVNPLQSLGDFFGTSIRVGGANNPVWAVILTFAMVFSVVFILVKKIHLFKDEENRGPAIIFALALSLLTIITTGISSVLTKLGVTVVYLVAIVAVLLLAWASYLGVHTSVSEGIGAMHGIASGRYEQASEKYKNKQVAKSAKSAYLETLSSYQNTEGEVNALKGLKSNIYKGDKRTIEGLLSLFNNLNLKQLGVKQKVDKILNRIARENLNKTKKAQVNKIVKDIETLEENFTGKIQEVRNAVEKVKAGIKINDFKIAESHINNALNLEQELESITKNIAKKETEVNGILLSP
ncbi:MAG: hypothetical protein AABX61_03680 [Nanoarchaeota archaeon]